MNTDRVIEWIAALRSGEYRQGQGTLRSRDGNFFCCLGVAADLAVGHGEGTWVNDDGYGFVLPNDDDPFYGLLPDTLHETLGLSADDEAGLIRMNDTGYSKSFAEIADHIEATILTKGR
jgi:hypothetical protein